MRPEMENSVSHIDEFTLFTENTRLWNEINQPKIHSYKEYALIYQHNDDLGNIQSKIFQLMGQVTEIQQGTSECHFEVVALDMMHYCATE